MSGLMSEKEGKEDCAWIYEKWKVLRELEGKVGFV
jgi:hypothetical protein